MPVETAEKHWHVITCDFSLVIAGEFHGWTIASIWVV